MDRDRFHNAARDGFLDALRETTRKDCNEKDEDGFTPTIVAALSGENTNSLIKSFTQASLEFGRL